MDLAGLGDEFDRPATLADWTVMQGDLITGEESSYDIDAGTFTVVAGRVT